MDGITLAGDGMELRLMPVDESDDRELAPAEPVEDGDDPLPAASYPAPPAGLLGYGGL